jgi:cytochrome oxidase Cu insertion factor (SCO1/SenC/PrrC family)
MRTHFLLASMVASTVFLTAACDKSSTATPDNTPSTPASTTAPVMSAPAASAAAPAMSAAPASATAAAGAEVGQAAPDFTLTDLDGKSVSLHDLKGKTVVLEWFNPHCPFVKAAHTKGSLKTMAADRVAAAKGSLVWLSINSGGAGKEGAGADASRDGAKALNVKNPILLDGDGKVGHLYGATNTPNLYVIAPDGTLAYRGAIDNSPDGELEAPTGGKVINYVGVALDALKSGTPIADKVTKPYGCSVKYAAS